MGGRSLLPAGVISVEGEFERGDAVRVLNPDGREVARGLERLFGDRRRAGSCGTKAVKSKPCSATVAAMR